MTRARPEDKPEWEPLPFQRVPGVPIHTMDAFLAMQKLVNTHHQMVVKDRSEAGAQPSQAACLRLLATSDGLSQRDIADAMRISRARVTYIVQAMEKAGTVYRARDGGDQRLTRVYLTDLGREIDRGMGSVREDHINEMFRDMPEEDQIELTRWLDNLSDRLKRAMHSGGAPATTDEPGAGSDAAAGAESGAGA